MKVKELIEELEKLNPEKEVILSKDEEGNGFIPLSAVSDNAVYVSEYNEIWPEELTEEMKKIWYTKEDVYDGDGGVKSVVLWS